MCLQRQGDENKRKQWKRMRWRKVKFTGERGKKKLKED